MLLQVMFAYKEAGERKQALVKVRLCPKHAMQLNYKQSQQLLKKRKQESSTEQEQPAKRHDRHLSPVAADDTGARGIRSDQAATAATAQEKLAEKKHQRPETDSSHELFQGVFD